MTLRRRLAALVVASAVAAAPTTCSVPAHADPEIPPAAAEAGVVDGGWVRVTCSGTTADQWCHLRFPDGFRRLDVTYIHGGDNLGLMSTYNHDEPGRVRDRIRRWKGRPVSGVRVKCMTVGGYVDCTVWIRERVRVYEDAYWSRRDNQGGIRFEADVPPATP